METEQINEERLKKFKEMGIPVPMKVVAPPLASDRQGNTPAHKILAEIKKGALKAKFNDILSKAEPVNQFQALPVPKSKKQPSQKISESTPQVTSFSTAGSAADAEAREIERMLFGGSSTKKATVIPDDKPINENYINSIPETDILSKFRKNMANKNILPSSAIPKEQETINVNLLETEEFKKKVISISRQVAVTVSKEMIKKVLVEYVKTNGDLIVESNKVKKAEIIDKNRVKIAGKIYKLIPEN